MNDFDITNDVAHNQPYSTLQVVMDIVFNFLAAVGVIAFAGFAGYMWTRFV